VHNNVVITCNSSTGFDFWVLLGWSNGSYLAPITSSLPTTFLVSTPCWFRSPDLNLMFRPASGIWVKGHVALCCNQWLTTSTSLQPSSRTASQLDCCEYISVSAKRILHSQSIQACLFFTRIHINLHCFGKVPKHLVLFAVDLSGFCDW